MGRVNEKSYGNAELLKETILKDNYDKSGIYRWVNNLNKKTYVGSGVNLAKRLGSYYNESELKRNSRPIKDALIKYGHKNFTLEILEYCPKTKLLCPHPSRKRRMGRVRENNFFLIY